MLTSAISVQEVPSQDSVFVTRVVEYPEAAIEAGADVPRPMPCLLEVFKSFTSVQLVPFQVSTLAIGLSLPPAANAAADVPNPKNLSLADRANYQAIRKTTSGARALKNVLGPGALALEGLFAAPFAAFDYARGRPGMDTLKSALSLGLLDQKLTTDELKKIFPQYGAAENLKNIGDRLTDLERLQKGTRGQRIRSQGMTKIAEDQFKKALQPFLDTGDPEKAYRENIQKSKDAEKELARQYKETAKDRTTQFDLSDPFMAAEGGLSGGDKSGPPPERGPNRQGLLSLMKRGMKI